MMIRTLALSIGVALGGCMVHTNDGASSTTTTTRAPYDPHFRVSDEIYSSCQLAASHNANMDVAEGTAQCLKTGPLNGQYVRISGSREEVTRARDRLVGLGVDANKVLTAYTDGPAYLEAQDTRLGKRRR
jgi:hypothetical protein